MNSGGVHLEENTEGVGLGKKWGLLKDIPRLNIFGTHKCVERINRKEFSILVQSSLKSWFVNQIM